jgi:DNA-binding transcriptional regulator YiaG
MTNHPNRNWRKRWPEEAGAFVRLARERLGLTQHDFAKLLDDRSSERTVQDWESGRSMPPQFLRFALQWLMRQRS